MKKVIVCSDRRVLYLSEASVKDLEKALAQYDTDWNSALVSFERVRDKIESDTAREAIQEQIDRMRQSGPQGFDDELRALKLCGIGQISGTRDPIHATYTEIKNELQTRSWKA
jgi:phage shock protein A